MIKITKKLLIANVAKSFLMLSLLFAFLLTSKMIKTQNNKNTKVCICTIGKNENRYIREFNEYYKKFGVDKIFLYDNNNLNDEHFENVIPEYINNGFVEIFNWRGIKRPHFNAINDCYLRFNKNYDWLIFYDIDEYIHLYNYYNIKDFLNEKKFNKCQKIYLNWLFHTDNNKIHYENNSLFKRFPEIERDAIIDKNFSQKVKSIIRGNISYFTLANTLDVSHIITKVVKGCNGFGKIINLGNETNLINSDSKYYYIDHFYTKSLDEFIDKIKRGSAVHDQNMEFKLFLES